MHHMGTQTIETGRLLLRRFTMDDAQAMFEGWASLPAVTQWLRWQPHKSWVETAEILYFWETQYTQPSFYQWAICLKDGPLIGSISLYEGETHPENWPEALRPLVTRWEPGYCLSPRYNGQGYASEALRAVCRFWFFQVGADWLSACHAVPNTASGRVLEKAGFRYDHNSIYNKYDGTPVDCRVFGLTKEDFKA